MACRISVFSQQNYRERLQYSRYHLEPFALFQSQRCGMTSTSHLTSYRQRLFPLHPRRYHQRRHQLDSRSTNLCTTLAPADIAGADRRRLLGLSDHGQRHHRAVSVLALHRAGAGTGRADREVHRHHHQYLHQAAQLRAVRAGVLAGGAQPCHGGRGLGPQQHDFPAGIAVRISESRPHHHHPDQRLRRRQHQSGRRSR